MQSGPCSPQSHWLVRTVQAHVLMSTYHSRKSCKPRVHTISLGLCAALTLFAVVFVVVEDEATAALTLIAAESVNAVLLAAAVVLGAFVLVCRRQQGKESRRALLGLRAAGPRGSGGPGWASSYWQSTGASNSQGTGQGVGAKAMTGSPAKLHQAEPAERSPAVGREGRSGWREGRGLALISTGTSTITCLLDRRTSGKTDTRTSRLQEKGAGRRGPSLLHNRKCHRHHQNGEGEVPLSAEGDRGGEESTSSVWPEEGPPGRAEVGGGGALRAPAHCPR